MGCGTPDPSTPVDRPSTRSSKGSRPPTTNAADADQAAEDKLVGTWVAEDVDSKIGQVEIKLTFRKEGGMKLAAWSDIPFVGQVRDKRGPYDVHGDVISSSAIRDGTSVKFRFEDDDLVIEYKDGKTVRFHRA